jgi:hypothetical protein
MDLPLSFKHKYSSNELAQSLYHIWELKTTFLFCILNSFSENFLFDINFPIDIIRFILLIYLKFEQNFIYPSLRWNFDCCNKECIIEWWSARPYKTEIDKYFHCYKKGCHNIQFNCFKCPLCEISLCNDCSIIGENIDMFQPHDENNLYSEDAIQLCIKCSEKANKDKVLNLYHICSLCKIEQEITYGDPLISCGICDIKLCFECSFMCIKSCHYFYCAKCCQYPLFINGICPFCFNKELLYKEMKLLCTSK